MQIKQLDKDSAGLYCIYIQVDTIGVKIMNLNIARWGNSLAVRIPSEYVKAIGIKEGDSVSATLTADGGISIRPAVWDRKQFAKTISEHRDKMPMTEPVVERMRKESRY
jgi:antitoxin MazE